MHHGEGASVVPVRFVQACVRGHISDIDWYAFMGRAGDRTGELWLDEGGAGNDFSEIFIRDGKTGRRRPLSDVLVPDNKVLGMCRGERPWLNDSEKCDKPNRLLIRAASNAYFSQTINAISIPEKDEALREAIDRVWDYFLQDCEGESDVRRERNRTNNKVRVAIEGFDDATVWAEIVRRRSQTESPEEKGLKEAEIETLLSQEATQGEDRPEGHFYARSHAVKGLPAEAEGKIEKLVLVHRLREVVAQLGFTRFEATFPDINGELSELDIDVRLAPISRQREWLPAYENRGEGIFLSFSPSKIEEWLARPAVQARGQDLMAGYKAWLKRKGLNEESHPFAGLPYIMLHTLSHLLLTALSLDCGYSASAIRERIYAGASGYGILLYTGSPGSEGTLGGLVDMGKDIQRHIRHALTLGHLCSNDPVCSRHMPSDSHEERYLHGAACHGCLLISETSCEHRNEQLDRALVVPTIDTSDAAFFM